MMDGKTPETCWAVNKRQDNKLKNYCIWLVIYLKCTMMHGITNLKFKNLKIGVRYLLLLLTWQDTFFFEIQKALYDISLNFILRNRLQCTLLSFSSSCILATLCKPLVQGFHTVTPNDRQWMAQLSYKRADWNVSRNKKNPNFPLEKLFFQN